MTSGSTKSTKKLGPKALTGSVEAKRQAAVILEVLSGIRGPSAGGEALGVSLTRYYALETRALQGLIEALEPLPRGRRQSAEDKLRREGRDRRRLERELGRAQALLRAAQRAIGIPAPTSPDKKTPSGRKRRRPAVRAMKAIAALQAPQASSPAPPAGESRIEVARS
jgi:hypothetical protein